MKPEGDKNTQQIGDILDYQESEERSDSGGFSLNSPSEFVEFSMDALFEKVKAVVAATIEFEIRDTEKNDNFCNTDNEDSDAKTETNSASFWFPFSSVRYSSDLVFVGRYPISRYVDKCIRKWRRNKIKAFPGNFGATGISCNDGKHWFLEALFFFRRDFCILVLTGEFKSVVVEKLSLIFKSKKLHLSEMDKSFRLSKN